MSGSESARPERRGQPVGGESPSLVFLNRFYWPDHAATGQMLTDLAEDLAHRGWKVTVIASRGRYAHEGELPREETRRGVRIVRVASPRFGRDRLVGRLGDYAAYYVGAFLKLLRLPRPDVAVAMTDPPFLVGAVLLVGRLRGFRTVYWLQDLYPHLAARMGLLPERGLLYRLANAVSRRIHARCDVVALGPEMARVAVEAGARPERTTYIHNWADTEALRPVPPGENPFLREHGLEGKFVVLYSGNAGRAHRFEAVIEAMRRLRNDPTIVFLWIGGGKQMAAIRETAVREGLANARFLGYLPRERLSHSLSAASVALVTEDPGVVGMLVPSKTYGILASGRPLLFVGSPSSDVARVVEEAECGVVVSPDDPSGLVDALLRLKRDPEAAEAMGTRARDAAEGRYARGHATRLWADLVLRLLRGEPASELPQIGFRRPPRLDASADSG